MFAMWDSLNLDNSLGLWEELNCIFLQMWAVFSVSLRQHFHLSAVYVSTTLILAVSQLPGWLHSLSLDNCAKFTLFNLWSKQKCNETIRPLNKTLLLSPSYRNPSLWKTRTGPPCQGSSQEGRRGEGFRSYNSPALPSQSQTTQTPVAELSSVWVTARWWMDWPG